MGNLALTFPDLSAASFQPWVNASDAQAEGITVEELAEKTATTWREGLAAQGIGPERDPAAEGRRRRDDLHAGLVGRSAAERDRLAPRARRSPGTPRPRRCGTRSKAP